MSAGRRAASLAITYALGGAAGLLAHALHVPLPYLLGPLAAIGIASATGRRRPVVRGGRQAGQAVVGAALGLYFTPEVVRGVGAALPWMLASSGAALVAGIAGASLLRRNARLDAATAFFAGVPGGAAEMAVLGEREGGDPAVIALAQSLRVATVVSILPLALTLLGARGAEPWTQSPPAGGLDDLLWLGAWCAGAGWITHVARLPNGWLLGSLAASAALTVSGLVGAAPPRPLVDAAQVAIGCALGSRFPRDLLEDARVLLPAIVLAVAQSLILLAGFGALLAVASGRSPFTLVLATAPGGIAEMCLTARTLHLGVPMVTAFHVVRLVVLLTLAPGTYRLWRAVVERRQAQKSNEAERLAGSDGESVSAAPDAAPDATGAGTRRALPDRGRRAAKDR